MEEVLTPAPQPTNPNTQPVVVQPAEHRSSHLPIILLLLLTLGMTLAVGYLLYQNTLLQQQLNRITAQQAAEKTKVVAATPTPAADPTASWQTYTDPTYGFTLKYPTGFVLTGALPDSLATWKPAKSISITDSNRPAQPRILIETPYDGYGPIFSSSTINLSFVGEKLVPKDITKVSAAEYQKLVDEHYVPGYEEYLSPVVNHNGAPFQFHISYSGGENDQLEQELLTILGTMSFTTAQ